MRAIDPHDAVDFLVRSAPQYAQAKAERTYIENFLRSKKSMLMQECNDKAIGAQERDAYAHPDYIALLDGLKAAVEAEELLRWQMEGARLRVDVWRSMESTARAQDKATA